MGLADFFRRREAKPAAAPSERPNRGVASSPAQPSASGSTGGPSIAYLFAHLALPSAAFANPLGFLVAMAQPEEEQQRTLKDLWERVCRHQSDSSTPTPESFEVHRLRLCGWAGLVVELPEPQRTTEAYLVAFLVKLPEGEKPSPLNLPMHYFTLEQGSNLAALLAKQNGIEEPYKSRVIAALRDKPRLLLTLLDEPPFRARLERDLQEELVPALRKAGLLDGALRRHFDSSASGMPNYESLVADAQGFALFLDEYAKLLKPTRTVLGAWTPDRSHSNFGDGPRVDRDAFLSDIAVLLLQQGE